MFKKQFFCKSDTLQSTLQMQEKIKTIPTNLKAIVITKKL